MAARFLRHFSIDEVADLERFALHPSRTIADVMTALAQRSVIVPQSTAGAWMAELRDRVIAQHQQQLAGGAPSPADVAARDAAARILIDQSRLIGEARMLRDDDDLTDELRGEIIARFKALIAQIGKSETWAAKSMGFAPSTLSQVLSNTYNGDTDLYVRRIDKWCEGQAAKAKAPRPTEYVKTQTAAAIIGAAKMAYVEEGIAVAYGPSGCGKTLTAQYLLSEYPGSIYVRITEGNKRPTALLEAIARELGVPKIKMRVDQLERFVVTALRDRLLIVDEIHALITGRSREEQSLNLLRGLHDEAKSPMLWLGTAEIHRYLEEGVGIRQGVDQIYGRVVWWLDLMTPVLAKETGPGHHTIEDIRKIIASRQMSVTSDGAQWLQDTSNTIGLGGLRAVDVLLRLLARLKPNAVANEQLFRDLQSHRLGRAVAGKLHSRVEEYRKQKVG